MRHWRLWISKDTSRYIPTTYKHPSCNYNRAFRSWVVDSTLCDEIFRFCTEAGPGSAPLCSSRKVPSQECDNTWHSRSFFKLHARLLREGSIALYAFWALVLIAPVNIFEALVCSLSNTKCRFYKLKLSVHRSPYQIAWEFQEYREYRCEDL
jgi:hypothetical protein